MTPVEAIEALVRNVAGDQYDAVRGWVAGLLVAPVVTTPLLLSGPPGSGKSTFASLAVIVAERNVRRVPSCDDPLATGQEGWATIIETNEHVSRPGMISCIGGMKLPFSVGSTVRDMNPAQARMAVIDWLARQTAHQPVAEPAPFTARVNAITSQLAELLAQKNAAYGDSFAGAEAFIALLWPAGVPRESYRDALLLVRAWDKIKRIATNNDPTGESPWLDIAGYAVLAMELRGR